MPPTGASTPPAAPPTTGRIGGPKPAWREPWITVNANWGTWDGRRAILINFTRYYQGVTMTHQERLFPNDSEGFDFYGDVIDKAHDTIFGLGYLLKYLTNDGWEDPPWD